MKEAAARIKINRLLEEAGWRFFAEANGPANVQLEPSVALTRQAIDALGENFEKVAGNRELISRFEKKIQTTVGRVWGEEKATTT